MRVPELSPCHHTDHRSAIKATCAMRTLGPNQCEVVIPTFDSLRQKRCTAILNLQTLKWQKLTNDETRIALYGGVTISVPNKSRILYLGGFDENGKKLQTIYELFHYDDWKLMNGVKLPHPVTSKHSPLDYFPMHLSHCNSSINIDKEIVLGVD